MRPLIPLSDPRGSRGSPDSGSGPPVQDEYMTTATDFRTITKKGWHTDPRGEHELRYHDGNDWTEHVTHFGPVPCKGCNPAVTARPTLRLAA